MIKVSVFYPNEKGGTFDVTYYCQKHMSLAQRLLGPAVKAVSVDQGIAGGEPGTPPPYLAMGHLLFESLDSFLASFLPHANELERDIPNFTNTTPTLQISEVKL